MVREKKVLRCKFENRCGQLKVGMKMHLNQGEILLDN